MLIIYLYYKIIILCATKFLLNRDFQRPLTIGYIRIQRDLRLRLIYKMLTMGGSPEVKDQFVYSFYIH